MSHPLRRCSRRQLLGAPLLATTAVLALHPAARGRAEERAAPLATRLAERVRVVPLRPASFRAAALRFPLRADPGAELRAARLSVEERPAEIARRHRLVLLLDEREEPSAPREWLTLSALVEAELNRRPADAGLAALLVEALVGADAGSRAVAAAERLGKLAPDSWRTHVLAGDAFLRRADFHWRDLVRLPAGEVAAAPGVPRVRADLAAAEREYRRALELAPAEGAPRSGLIALEFARPMMAALLPMGVLEARGGPDVERVRGLLREWVERARGPLEPCYHLAHFLAAYAPAGVRPTAAELQALSAGLAAARTEAGLLAEARGLLSLAVDDLPASRDQLLAASTLLPARVSAAAWLAVADTAGEEPPAARLARLRARPASERPEARAALAVALAEENRAEAIALLRETLRGDPDHLSTRYCLGALLLRERPSSSEARHHLRQVWESGPEDAEASFAFLVARAIDGERPGPRNALRELLRDPELSRDLRARVEETLADLALPLPPDE